MNKKQYKKISDSIRKMVAEDQCLRKSAEKSRDWKSVKEADKKHTRLLKSIISKHGWPTIQDFGKEASEGAWLLAQHADHDLKFQERCLGMMNEAFDDKPESVSRKYIAYLTDRVLVNSGKKQRFGTQFKRNTDGSLALYPVVNRNGVNRLRKQYGLESISEYREIITLSP
ncbi:MAG: hypothetical protein KGI49_02510 [Patescibacteria group bacterium]|nr:hypothetical protein [Patescibacteria group bacterium]